MTRDTLQDTARLVAEHRLARRKLPKLETLADFAEAYRVQAMANEILARSPLGAVSGHKVGSTNARIQAALGVDHPVAGRVFANTVHASPARLRHGDYVRVGVECEVVFRLGAPLPATRAPYTLENVLPAIDAVMPGMEIIDDRYEVIDAKTLVADNALDAGALIGEPRADWRDLGLAQLSGVTLVNGTERARGRGADVLGNPLNVVVWLANHAAQYGEGLAAGTFIFTGSMTDIVWLKPGDKVATRIDGLGSVTANFT
jgi:2-keto-4-pentenoate hydratase